MKKISRKEWIKDITEYLNMNIQNARAISFYVQNDLYNGMGTEQMIVRKTIEYLTFIEKFNYLCFYETIEGIRELKQKEEAAAAREDAGVVQFPNNP
jgi:hypothetical protein